MSLFEVTHCDGVITVLIFIVHNLVRHRLGQYYERPNQEWFCQALWDELKHIRAHGLPKHLPRGLRRKAPAKTPATLAIQLLQKMGDNGRVSDDESVVRSSCKSLQLVQSSNWKEIIGEIGWLINWLINILSN